MPTFAKYEQRSGLFEIFSFVDDGGTERCLYQCVGYAGRGGGKNNHDAQTLKNVGPIPVGVYRVRAPIDHPAKGPMVFRLEPYRSNQMFGRSGFLIHGDSRKEPGNASHGCIILARQHREAVEHFGVKYLEVVPGPAKSPKGEDLNLTK